MEADERQSVVTEAREWLGTPFQHRQRLKGVGCDCLTYVEGVFKAVGLIPAEFDAPYYAPDEHLHRSGEKYAEGLLEFCASLGMIAPLPGDLVAFSFGRRVVAHLGICVDFGGWFLSAHMDCGRVEQSRLSERYWARRFSGVWRPTRWHQQVG